MKKKLFLLMMMLMMIATMCAFAACGTSGGTDDTISDDEIADQWTFGEPSVRVWESGGTELIEMMVPVTNNSKDYKLYCSGVDYSLKDKDGNTVFTCSAADMAPLYLEPGDTGIIYNMQKYECDTPYSDDMTLEYDAKMMTVTWAVETLEVNNLTFESPLNTSYIIRGDIINNTDVDAEMPMVSIIFYDKNGDILGGSFGYGDDTIPAGSTGTFKSGRYEFKGGLDNMASYKAYAYVTEN